MNMTQFKTKEPAGRLLALCKCKQIINHAVCYRKYNPTCNIYFAHPSIPVLKSIYLKYRHTFLNINHLISKLHINILLIPGDMLILVCLYGAMPVHSDL